MTVVFIGPKLHPLTGQSASFHAVAQSAGPDDVIVINSGEGLSSLSLVWHAVKAWMKLLSAMLSRNAPTAVYFCCSRSLFGFLRDATIVITASLRRSTTIVNHLHGADFARFRAQVPQLLRVLIDFVYRRVAVSIVPHASMVDQFAMYPHMVVVPIDNWIEDEFRLNTERPGTCAAGRMSELRVLFLSNLIKEKGVNELLSAVRALRSEGVNVALELAGHPMHGISLGRLEPFIRYHGPLFGKAKRDAFERADVFVLPSYGEAVPIAAIEAAAMGCPIVLTGVDYLPEVFRDFGVRFIRPRSVEDILIALRELANSPRDRRMMSVKNLQITRGRFGKGEFVESVYRAIAAASETKNP